MYHEERPAQPVVPYVEAQPRRRGCLGCLGRAFIGSLLLLALLVFGGILVASTLIYANFSREIEAGITKLDAAPERETFETTLILDRQGNVLWEIFW